MPLDSNCGITEHYDGSHESLAPFLVTQPPYIFPASLAYSSIFPS